jgi:uncharacterized protein
VLQALEYRFAYAREKAMNNVGRFIWYDLMTSDPKAAAQFYGEIVGWTTESGPKGGGYTLWKAGQQAIGGLMTLDDDAKKQGIPPYWIGYVESADVDATVKKAVKLGGRILHPSEDIASVGRFAVLADPQGAAFVSFKPIPPVMTKGRSDSETAQDHRALGHLSWAELNTTDWKSAWTFYRDLFGWQPTRSMDMGPDFGEYFMFGTDSEVSMGGMSNAANMMHAPPHWLHYINVKSVDETAARITKLGGKVLNGPMDIPGNDRIAQCRDPQGAVFAIYSSGSGA